MRCCTLAIALLLAAQTARAVELEGTWYLLVHYRDASSSNPDALRWEDRVWHFQREGERLLWTDYELVNFVDARGRFERDRRVVGPWEPSRSQRREIERGLFANPRGARVLALEQREEGEWRTRVDSDALRKSRAVMSFGLAGSIAGARDLPTFSIDEMLHRPDSIASLSRTVMTTESASTSGDQLTGSYTRGGTRTGSFRMVPTSLRRRLNPHAAFTSSGIAMKPDSLAQWANFLPALARPWHYFPQRSIRIETNPPGALLDLAYLRHGARLMFEQVRAPLEVELPSRFVAHRSDALSVQAFVPGYQPARITALLHGDTEELADRSGTDFELGGDRRVSLPGAARRADAAHPRRAGCAREQHQPGFLPGAVRNRSGRSRRSGARLSAESPDRKGHGHPAGERSPPAASTRRGGERRASRRCASSPASRPPASYTAPFWSSRVPRSAPRAGHWRAWRRSDPTRSRAARCDSTRRFASAWSRRIWPAPSRRPPTSSTRFCEPRCAVWQSSRQMASCGWPTARACTRTWPWSSKRRSARPIRWRGSWPCCAPWRRRWRQRRSERQSCEGWWHRSSTRAASKSGPRTRSTPSRSAEPEWQGDPTPVNHGFGMNETPTLGADFAFFVAERPGPGDVRA